MTLEYSLLEDLLSETQSHLEIEYVFFGRPRNFDFMKKYPSDKIEQYEVDVYKKNGDKNKIRVRKQNQKKITMALKLIIKPTGPGALSVVENEFDITEESFQIFKKLSTSGFNKERFKVKTKENLMYEIDVFYDDHGNINPWVKIDLEVPSTNTKVPPLPIEIDDLITNQKYNRTKEEEETVERVWNSFMIT